ncbi:MAG: JAB domain-containing protein [Chitinophagaceae bacterium]|nr:JAB domain-containing protein [Chitinophagaceae bacterium]
MKSNNRPQEANGQTMPEIKTVQLKKFILSTDKTGIELPDTIIRTSHECAQLCRHIHRKEGNDFQEFFYVMFLNRANRITGYYVASMGGVTGTVADPRLIVKAAALADCVSVVLFHNHPSGSTKPSRADEQLTAKIKEAFSYFDITVLDHVICGDDQYYSFADEGIL